jgi:regulator of sirC expression with transglutaminase-like and TPR domain
MLVDAFVSITRAYFQMTPAGKLSALEARRQLAAIIEGDAVETADLARAALLIASEETRCDVGHYLELLADYGRRAQERISLASRNAIATFNEFIFDEMGFAGNQIGYYDPRNSFLDYVLDRRVGIPITLSIVYIEIGRRAGLKVNGIGFPGHFIVRAREDEDDEGVLVDSFHARTLDRADCQDLLDTAYGGSVALSNQHLRPATNREILERLLRNLKSIYAQAGLHRNALAAVERILLLTPTASEEHRDRGVLLGQLNRFDEAIRETRIYLRARAAPADAEQVREHLHTLQKRQAMLN